jgi:hypothetical protein
MKSMGSPNDRLSSGRNIVANALWDAKSRSYEYSSNTCRGSVCAPLIDAHARIMTTAQVG